MLWAADARLVVQVWFVSRLVLALTLVWLMVTEGRGFDELDNWDVGHFLQIAAQGYTDPTKYAFFPGWPLLLRAFGYLGIPMLLTATLLALAFSAVAAAALYRLAGAGAAIAWLLAPTAIFTAVGYTESLFCATAFWAWERATARHWAAAGVLAAVAASVRVSGVFLIAALAVLAITSAAGGVARPATGAGPALPGTSARPSVREAARRLVWLLLPVAVVAAYLGYLYAMTGSWLTWFDAQAAGWTRQFTWPWDSLRRTIDATDPAAYPQSPEWAQVFRYELVSMAVGVVVTLVALLRRRWAEAVFVGLQVVAFATSPWFLSVNRAVLLWFPGWILIGRLAEGRHPITAARQLVVSAAVVVALLVQVWWAWLFLTGRWAS